MTSPERGPMVEGADQVIESVRDAEQFAIDAVRKFVDAVDSIFPDLSQGARRKIIDAAFRLTEHLLSAWTQAAEEMMKAAGGALVKPVRKVPAKNAAVKRAPAKKKAAVKRAPAKKAAVKKAAQRRGGGH